MFQTLFWKKGLEKDIPVMEKSMDKVTVFHYQESRWGKFDMFWKNIDFWDACFTKILDPLLEFLLKMETLKVGTSSASLIWKCPPPAPAETMSPQWSVG